MKLDRNIIENFGRGKYALIKLRRLENFRGPGTFDGFGAVGKALETLDKAGLIEWGAPNTEGELFVLKLRDAFSEPALVMYANTAMLAGESEYAREVKALADRSGSRSPFCKNPD